MMLFSKARCGCAAVALCLAVLLISARPVWAGDIVSSWSEMKIPPPITLKPVHIEAGETALLVLDFAKGTCNTAQRPRCFDSIPIVAKLLTNARAHGVHVVFSTVPNGSISDSPPSLMPKPGEPSVTAGAEKFTGTELGNILRAQHVRTVIVTGTIAQGAVLFTASAAALRGYNVIVPVDTMSSGDAFGELAAAYILANGPASVSSKVTMTRSDMIGF